MSIRVVVIVAAGGRGERLAAGVPKQFRLLAGRPLLNWSVSRLCRAAEVKELIVGAPQDWVSATREIVAPACGSVPAQVVAGGAHRQDTVRRCLAARREEAEVVLIHDAARPFLGREMIEKVIATAAEEGAATLAMRPVDTIKLEGPNGVMENLPRDRLWQIQTPQAFRRELLERAHAQAEKDGVIATDDAGLVERLGKKVEMVAGNPLNLKITTAEDWRMAEALAAAGLVEARE
jgi:2-C-methyl-D-erythritol 4-phosphate cytidylyltransferase